MESIVPIHGRVKYKITLDPGVWIFDDRKIDLDTYFSQATVKEDDLEEYTKSVSRHWDREIMEGSVFPPTLKSEKKFTKERILNGSFGIPLKPFLIHAEPEETASTFIIHTKDDSISISLESAYGLILGFSQNGKPLSEDGPLHAYFSDGSNADVPIKDISGFTVE